MGQVCSLVSGTWKCKGWLFHVIGVDCGGGLGVGWCCFEGTQVVGEGFSQFVQAGLADHTRLLTQQSGSLLSCEGSGRSVFVVGFLCRAIAREAVGSRKFYLVDW